VAQLRVALADSADAPPHVIETCLAGRDSSDHGSNECFAAMNQSIGSEVNQLAFTDGAARLVETYTIKSLQFSSS
jgi:hypothetical protein